MTLDKILFVAGLVFDIAGAYFLARGIARKPLRDMADESAVGWGGPPNLHYVAGVLGQKVDADVGVGLLVLGFLIQAGAYLFPDLIPPWSLSRWYVIGGGVALLVLLLLLGNRCNEWFFRRDGRYLLAYVVRSVTENGNRKAGAEGYTCKAAEKLTPWFGRQSHEDDAAFAQRVWLMIESTERRLWSPKDVA